MRIYLIGFMGSGKTRWGRKLSAHIGLQQIDLDHFIEESRFMTVPEIFRQYGEEEFRKIEHQKLKELSSFENVIISTGGGAPCYFNNMELMNETGITIFLNPKPKKLAKRLLKSKNERPLIKGMEKKELIQYIKGKLAERLPYYSQAQYTIKPGKNTVEELAKILAK